MELDQTSLELLDQPPHPKKDSPTREFFIFCNIRFSTAMKAKTANKWTEGTIDKYLKSPADYAPGNH